MDATEQTPGDAILATGIDPATGFATDGEYPVNGRLRAEAMHAAGVTTDPAGIVSDELIAATGERVAREQAEADANTPSLEWTVKRLREEADRLGVAIEGDANKAAILAAIQAAPTAAQTEA